MNHPEIPDTSPDRISSSVGNAGGSEAQGSGLPTIASRLAVSARNPAGPTATPPDEGRSRRGKASRNRGARYERVVCERLEALGYVVHRAAAAKAGFGEHRWTVSNDVFGVFDAVAVLKRSAPQHLPDCGWFQVTSAGAASARRRKLEAFFGTIEPDHDVARRSRLLIYEASGEPGSRARWRCQLYREGEWQDESAGDAGAWLAILGFKAKERR